MRLIPDSTAHYDTSRESDLRRSICIAPYVYTGYHLIILLFTTSDHTDHIRLIYVAFRLTKKELRNSSVTFHS